MRIAALPCERQTCIFENKQHSQTNYKSYLRHGVVFNSHIFYKFIAESSSEKSLFNRCTFCKIAGTNVDCTLMIVSKSSFLGR